MNGDRNEIKAVITGIGVISPLGNDLETFWSNLVAGTSGVGAITHFDPTGYATRIAAQVKDFDPTVWMDRKDAKRNDRFVQLSVAAALEAVKAARLDVEASDPNRVGVIIGSGIGGIATFEEQHESLLELKKLVGVNGDAALVKSIDDAATATEGFTGWLKAEAPKKNFFLYESMGADNHVYIPVFDCRVQFFASSTLDTPCKQTDNHTKRRQELL